MSVKAKDGDILQNYKDVDANGRFNMMMDNYRGVI